MQNGDVRPYPHRNAARRRDGIEPLERRVLLSAILVVESGGELAYFENTDGVTNQLILSTGPGAGNGLIKDSGDTLELGPGVAALGWTLSSDAHTAFGPEAQIDHYLIDTGDGNDTVAIQANDRPIKVQPRIAIDTVVIGTNSAPTGAQLNTAPIFFDCQFAMDGVLTVNDAGDPTPRDVRVTGSSVIGLTPGAITFDTSVEELTLISGSGGDTTTVNQTVENANPFGTTFILQANGNDTVNVKQLATNSQVLTQELNASSIDSVNIGNNGQAREIFGNVDVDGFAGTANLTLDLSADTLPSRPTVFNSGGGDGMILGFGPGSVDFIESKIQNLTLIGGSAGNQISFDLPGGVRNDFSAFIVAGSGDDTVNVASNPSNGSLHVDGGGGNDRVNIGGSQIMVLRRKQEQTGKNQVNIGAADAIAPGLQGSIAVSDDFGSVTILVDASDLTPTQPTVTVNDATVLGLIPATLSFSSDASLAVIGTSAIETFNVTPSATTSFAIDGGLFAPRATAADVLNVNTAGVTSPVLHLQTDAAGEQGSFTFANRQPVAFTRFGGVTPALATISGTVSNAQTALPVAGAPLFLDQNTNGSFDAGEPTVLSDALGNYQFTSLAAGSYHLLLGTGPFVAVASPPTTTVAAGQVAAGINLAVVPAPTPGGPDLAGQLIAPAALGGSSKGKVKLKITNAGLGAASASVQVALFASADAVLDTTDTSLGSPPATKLKLGRGASKTLSLTANVPSSIADGNYFVLASIDSTNAAAESNEANNVAASGAPVTIAHSFIDLSGAFAGKLPKAISSGKAAAVSILVGNIGNVAATGSISISLFASADRSHGPADTLITTITGQKIAIKPNRSHPVLAHLQTPAGLAKGNYFLIAVVNSDQTVADANPANDVAVSSVAVPFN